MKGRRGQRSQKFHLTRSGLEPLALEEPLDIDPNGLIQTDKIVNQACVQIVINQEMLSFILLKRSIALEDRLIGQLQVLDSMK